MAAIQGSDFHEWLRTADGAMVQHMRKAVQAQGRELTDVSELFIHHFVYIGESNTEWTRYEPVPVWFYELTFTDKTFVNHFWHKAHGPITFEQAKEALDLERLTPGDRQFIEEYSRNNQFRCFAEKLFDELLQIGMDIDVGNDWKARWKHRIAQRAYDLAWHICYQISDLRGVELSNSEMLDAVSDLNKWPEESKIV